MTDVPSVPDLPPRVRAMASGDLPFVAAIEAQAFSDPWPLSAFEELLSRDHARMQVVAHPRDGVLGYCIVLRAADEAEIANIATAAAVRRQGVAGMLLDGALALCDREGARAVYLEVRESNVPARALYGSRGFREIGRRRRYYRQPDEDALILRRDGRPPIGAGAANESPMPWA